MKLHLKIRKKDHSSDLYLKEDRRLHRDLDNNLLGGVCSGIAAYFNVDTVWIRLAFVILFLLKGAGLLAYLILWFVIPAARTTAQKLQMHGRPVNIETIEQTVKDEYNKVRKNMIRVSKSESFKRMQSTSAEIFAILGSIFFVILKVILVIIGITFIMGAIFLLLGFLSIAPFNSIPHVSFQNFPFWEQISPLIHNVPLFTIALAVVILVPLFGILTLSIRFIFNLKKRNNVLSAFSWTFWSLAFVFIIIAVISGETNLSIEEKIEDEAILNVAPDKSLTVTIDEESFLSSRKAHYNIFGNKILYNHNTDNCYIQPHFIISNSVDSSFYLEISRISALPFSGHNDHYYPPDYNWQLNDTILILDQYFSVDDQNIWTIPDMIVTLKIPKGKKVIMKGDANSLFELKTISDDTLSNKEIIF